jgi:uncharacterized protein YjbI with pentapeptide repeats
MDVLRFPLVRVATLLVAWIVTTATASANEPGRFRLGPRAGELTVGPGMNAAGRNLRGSSFEQTDLSGADFSDCDLFDVSFRECNLRNARFHGARMNATVIEECDTAGADFSDVVIDNRTRYHRLEITPDQLKSTKSYASKELTGCHVFSPPKTPGRYDFRGFSFHNCTFLGDFAGSDFTDATFAACHFPDGILFEQLASSASYKNKFFLDVHINGIGGPADFTDVKFADSTLRIDGEAVFENTRFTGRCKLLGNFGPSHLRTTYNYRQGDLAGLRFDRIDFSGFDFSGENLTGTEFTRCTFQGAAFDDAVISGAKFYADQKTAPSLTADQIRSTWNFKRGRMQVVELPAALLEALQLEPAKK